MLTKDDANNIVTSWQSLAGKELQTMTSFYNALFKMAPEVRFYFPDDMSSLSKKLQMTIDVVIDNIHDVDALVPELHKLGRFHKNKIGVESSHYPFVVKALLFTIRKAMGDDYTNDVGESWRKMLVFISRHMIAAPPKERNAVVKFFKKVFS
ncbi:globin domain-containing protein [Ekhidna sp. To15]|uniref:globin domain-containing protein n=1 Tax=Ekhidna sp. To15 TaxID=3395267 RepID=UPI003F522696